MLGTAAVELTCGRSLRHPNCALFLGYTEPPNFCLVMEFMGMGSLRELLDNARVRMNIRHVLTVLLSVRHSRMGAWASTLDLRY